MAALSHLAALDAVAHSRDMPLSPEMLTLLAWSECLLRADKPSLKRVAQCSAALRSAFGISI